MGTWSKTAGICATCALLAGAAPVLGLAQAGPVQQTGSGMEADRRASLDRHRERRAALERQRRGEVFPVVPLRGISLDAPARSATPAGAAGAVVPVAGTVAGSGRPASIRPLFPAPADEGARADAYLADPFAAAAFPGSALHPGARFGPFGSVVCMTVLEGRGWWPGAANVAGTPGFSYSGHCRPLAAAYGTPWAAPFPGAPVPGAPSVVPWPPRHRFHDRFRPRGAEGGGVAGHPPAAALFGASCVEVAVVTADGRRFHGATWVPALAAEAGEAELVLEAALSQGRPLVLFGRDGGWVQIPPGTPLDDLRASSCAGPAVR